MLLLQPVPPSLPPSLQSDCHAVSDSQRAHRVLSEYYSVCVCVCVAAVCQLSFLQEDALNKSRTEDAIIAFTWYHFFQHPDQPEYLLRLPMTKVGAPPSLPSPPHIPPDQAAVRAMDTMADFAAKKNPSAKLSKFMVAGASKVRQQQQEQEL